MNRYYLDNIINMSSTGVYVIAFNHKCSRNEFQYRWICVTLDAANKIGKWLIKNDNIKRSCNCECEYIVNTLKDKKLFEKIFIEITTNSDFDKIRGYCTEIEFKYINQK